jgi:hypothetical protein
LFARDFKVIIFGVINFTILGFAAYFVAIIIAQLPTLNDRYLGFAAYFVVIIIAELPTPNDRYHFCENLYFVFGCCCLCATLPTAPIPPSILLAIVFSSPLVSFNVANLMPIDYLAQESIRQRGRY